MPGRPDRRRPALARPGYTIADGIYVKRQGELTTSMLDTLLDDMVDVSADEEITKGDIVLLLEVVERRSRAPAWSWCRRAVWSPEGRRRGAGGR